MVRRNAAIASTLVVALFALEAVSPQAATRAAPEAPGIPPATAGPAAATTRQPVQAAVSAAASKPCPQAARPRSRAVAWFSSGKAGAPSPIAQGLVRTICAAARNATIRIAVYYAYAGTPDVERIFDALRFVQRQRGVRVGFVLDQSMYASRGDQKSLSVMRRFADVVTCSRGCRSVGNKGVAHNKFVVVTNTVWRRGIDPVVVASTSNWTELQLRRYHQSAVRVWDDPRLAREMSVRWFNLRTCAIAGCTAWNSQLERHALDPDVYEVARRGHVYVDPGLGERRGTLGRGTRVSFSPTAVADPIARQLLGYRCRPGHNTVRVAQLQVSRPEVIDALATLQQRGCNVRVLVSAWPKRLFIRGTDAMRDAGLQVGCVRGLHEKYVFVDGVAAAANRPERMLWVGSQNFGRAGVRTSDNTMLRLTPRTAGPIARTENARVLDRFARNFRFLTTRVSSCPARAESLPQPARSTITTD